MKIRNEQQYPVFHRYAGKGRAGRNLKPGQVSPEVPNDRIHLSVVQRHLINKQISVFVTSAEREALKGNVPDDVYNLISTSEPECAVAKARTAPKAPAAPQASVLREVKEKAPPKKAIKAPPAAPEEPAAEVVEEPEAPKTGKAPDPAAQPKSKHLDEKPKEGPAKTAKDLTEDPVKKHAKKTTAKKPAAKAEDKKPAEKKPAAKKSTAKKPEEKKAAAPKKEATVKDYKDLDKAALLKEFENRGLKKPAPTTSTTRLRSKLIKDDESK